MGNIRYIDVVDVAKLVRRALKAEFPGIEFQVRSNRYSTGKCGAWDAGIIVLWLGGPPQPEVREIVRQYEGSRLDANGDSFIPVNHWLRPDGTALIRHAPFISPDQPEIDNRHPVFLSTDRVEAVQFMTDMIVAYRDSEIPPEPLTLQQRYGDWLRL